MLPLYLAVEGTPVEESGPNPVIPNVGELIIGLLTFGIVVFVLMKVRVAADGGDLPGPPRCDRGWHQAGRGGPGRGAAAADRIPQQLSEARTEAAQIRDNARAEGQRIIEEMRPPRRRSRPASSPAARNS
jgi:F-type H+-transporting ATPase subunit b